MHEFKKGDIVRHTHLKLENDIFEFDHYIDNDMAWVKYKGSGPYAKEGTAKIKNLYHAPSKCAIKHKMLNAIM